MGIFPNLFADGQFPKDAASLNQFLRQITPNTGAYDLDVVSDAVAAVFDRIGEGVLITHSQGGGPGWQTVLKNPEKVKAVVSYEPGTEFVFPENEMPSVATPASGSIRFFVEPFNQCLPFRKIVTNQFSASSAIPQYSS